MPEPLHAHLAQARGHLVPNADRAQLEANLQLLERRIVRRRRAVQASTAAAGLALVLGLFLHLQHKADPTLARLETHDGSVATALGASASLVIDKDAPAEVALSLVKGAGHFEVTPNPKRRYRVRAGAVSVEVLGTGFDVTRRGSATEVRVQHGLVRVGWADGSALLHAGESGVFPPPAPRPEATPRGPQEAIPTAQAAADAHTVAPDTAAPQTRTQAPNAEAWRKLARAGKHREAFGSLAGQPVDDLQGLLLAADAARLSGHGREAAQYLEKLVTRYPKSEQAKLGAFTLGRLSLYDLADPARAARSFASAYALDPHGPLAEDALAREAEAYHRAGDAVRASSAARRYLEAFPQGTRRTVVSGYLGE
jgi:transmembrane sensor